MAYSDDTYADATEVVPIMIESLDQLRELLATMADAPLPDENRRVARGHTRGPQVVALPDGWLEDPYDNAVADADGDSAASGG